MEVDQALAEMHRILKPGGKLFVVVHGSGYGLDYLWRRKGLFRGRTFQLMGQKALKLLRRSASAPVGGSRASRYLTVRELRARLGAAGFASIHVHFDPQGQRFGKFPVYVGATGVKSGAEA
jgi:ubiquinone/menaquinone biosynthesis C-methylase UbiE